MFYKYEHLSLERNLGTAPNPIHWCVYRISLDTYSAKYWGSSGVEGVFVLPLLVAKNYDNSLFYSTKFISKEVTPMILIQICTLYRPRQASMTPYNLFGKSLFSHFHTEPLIPARNYFKNLTEMIGTRTQQVNLLQGLFNYYPFHLLNLILQYTNKKPYESSFFSH